MEATSTNPTGYAQGLLDSAKAKITAGCGEVGFMQSGELRGKQFSRVKELSAVDVVYAARRALDIYNDDAGTSPFTFPDFGNTFL